MSLLSRYVCRVFVQYFGLGLSGCAGLFFLIELFDRIDNFIDYRTYWVDVVYYLLLRLPDILYLMAPVACILASVLTFSTLNKHSEIVAMRAAGVAPLRLATPLFVLGVIACGALLALQEYVLPYTSRAEREVWRTRIQGKADAGLGRYKTTGIWYRRANRIWQVGRSEVLENRLVWVTIYKMTPEGNIRQRIDAQEAYWDGAGWHLRQGTVRAFSVSAAFATAPQHFAERLFYFPERPTEISALPKGPEEMGLRESLAYAKQSQRQGLHQSGRRYLVAFHGKLAFAVVCIIMVGFGAPLALTSNRSGGTARAIALTLVCGFSYWILHSLAMALGQSGYLPPILAAWMGNVCFGTGSLYLTVQAR
ncbi:LPS export ABC transporter permease LptG [Candidatus Entotheonella serta]|nr:LPS export ABC transporter permease LptG [Candidatus Entotheonella serta]